MPDVLIPDDDIRMLAGVHSALIQSMLDMSKKYGAAAAWDKVTWGRTSAKLDLADEIETGHDARPLAIQMRQLREQG